MVSLKPTAFDHSQQTLCESLNSNPAHTSALPMGQPGVGLEGVSGWQWARTTWEGHKKKRWGKMQEWMRTSLRSPPCVLDAAAAPEQLGPTRPGSGFDKAPRLRCLSPGLGILLWSHCALIRSRSRVSSIPVPSSSSPPAAASAAVAVTNRASQEPARCSCRARAACKQSTRGRKKEREGERDRERERERQRKGEERVNDVKSETQKRKNKTKREIKLVCEWIGELPQREKRRQERCVCVSVCVGQWAVI